MSNNAKEAEHQNKTLKETYENMLLHYRNRKSKMNLQREKEKEKLTKITLMSNKAIKHLTETKEKSEKILRVSEMCRKMETEEEKVLPFYSSSVLTEEEKTQMETEANTQTAEDQANLKLNNDLSFAKNLATVSDDYLPMENFWKRYNKVLLDKLALKKEQNNLENENANLRQILKQYLDGISVNEETLASSNPLFVVNNRTNVNLEKEGQGKSGSRTVVEAAHIVNNIL